MAWYGMVWYGMVWYGVVWRGMVWYGAVRYGLVWCGMVWYGLVWYGIIWYGIIWYGKVWHGVVCTAQYLTAQYCMVWLALYDTVWNACTRRAVSHASAVGEGHRSDRTEAEPKAYGQLGQLISSRPSPLRSDPICSGPIQSDQIRSNLILPQGTTRRRPCASHHTAAKVACWVRIQNHQAAQLVETVTHNRDAEIVRGGQPRSCLEGAVRVRI